MFKFEKNSVSSVIKNLNKGKVLVIGDFALDEMIYGHTSRISREAPVLILKHNNTNIILGAAANAAHNISTLNNGKATAIGVYGDDYHGPVLLETLKHSRIDTSLMVMDKSRVTTTKTRISGFSTQSVTQQIVRIDRESNTNVSGDLENKIIDNIRKAIPEHDAVLLSDYDLGMMTQEIIDISIETANNCGKFIAVDTQLGLERFKNVTVLTPNQPDAEKSLGYLINSPEKVIQAGKDLIELTNSKMILLTRGDEGMVIFESNGNHAFIPAFNKTDVFDVTGAGDTVVASFTLGICAGASSLDSAIIGNLAASIVIKHFGCATTTANELMFNLERLNMEDFTIRV
ncbi:MAG: PfkB family carbohydrate kinase [Candidatus Gastranaerophilaceae bacterium]